jgi:ABC-type ATPase with predicted acetyltransferase domain
MTYELPQFLPGTLTIERGTPRDYFALEQFHYIPRRPATWATVRVVRYEPHAQPVHGPDLSRVVAVGVLSYPVPSSIPREQFLRIQSLSRREKLVFVNQHLRTISRVVVHPQFRSLGLSSVLVRCLCKHCDTRYVEAIARMARAHPFFDRAGMTRIAPANPDQPVYFILDREQRAALPKAG